MEDPTSTDQQPEKHGNELTLDIGVQDPASTAVA